MNIDKNKRPTSPHLTIYKMQISSVLSILHRLTGIGLFLGFGMIAWWFTFWVFSKFDPMMLSILNNFFVRIILYLVSAAFFYHLSTGIRHIFWDMGYGYSLPVMHKTGWIAVIAALFLTFLFWVII